MNLISCIHISIVRGNDTFYFDIIITCNILAPELYPIFSPSFMASKPWRPPALLFVACRRLLGLWSLNTFLLPRLESNALRRRVSVVKKKLLRKEFGKSTTFTEAVYHEQKNELPLIHNIRPISLPI